MKEKKVGSNISVSIADDAEPPEQFNIAEIERFLDKVLFDLNYENWELSVVFCNDEFIRNLNKQYRNIDAPTDVLSFEQGDRYIDENDEVIFIAGDIVISFESLYFNVKEFSVNLNEELKRLLIHGVLHLGGMDHEDNSPDQEMLQKQENLLLTYGDFKLI
ncbi:MAG: rRNA maturation RNase YbeY [Treponema sp.]|nr:MAG: rRNA maturation RNase YbeY [Treponema sp.]